MKKSKVILMLGAPVVALMTACVAVVPAEPNRRTAHHHRSCAVPPGHLPPPGECRVWYPDLPPGQQPPPGDCGELQHHLPPGACLVYGD